MTTPQLDCQLTHTQFCRKYKIPTAVRHLVKLGHGHVNKLPDGSSMPCGGVPSCSECANEFARAVPSRIIEQVVLFADAEGITKALSLPELSALHKMVNNCFSAGVQWRERHSPPVSSREAPEDCPSTEYIEYAELERKLYKMLRKLVKKP